MYSSQLKHQRKLTLKGQFLEEIHSFGHLLVLPFAFSVELYSGGRRKARKNILPKYDLKFETFIFVE
jgi:hypothetical protein